MAPPDTDLERQKRQHRWPLIGIGVAVVFAVGMMLLWLFGATSDATPPQGAEIQIDGRTGDPIDGTPPESGPTPVD